MLDEATSALDTETERAVQAALDELARGRTTRRDRAPALDRPRRRTRSRCSTAAGVVELGDHDELIAAGGRYAAMIEVQGGELATA